jgi:hypothetical protein
MALVLHSASGGQEAQLPTVMCRFTGSEVAGALLVAVGAAIVAGGDPESVMGIDTRYCALYAASLLLPAIDVILKEKLFAEGSEQLGGRPLNIFCVSTFGSLSQVCFYDEFVLWCTFSKLIAVRIAQYMA